MFTSTKLAKSIKLACAFGVAGAASLTSATVVAQEADESASVEKIQVTGSRIKRTTLESSSPVLEITAEAIQSTGFTRIEDVMNQLPQIEAAQTTFQANGATGTASLDLRGLGTERTLVLVNGRRLQPGGVRTQAADVNQIPTSLIKRVDVLTGGASTTYGADAVAGVVNFVMDNEFTGVEINGGVSGYQHDNDNAYIQDLMDQRDFDYPDGSNGIGGKAYNLDITIGSDFADGDGHITTYATWRRNEEMLQGERDYSSCALNAGGTSCGGSANSILPTLFVYPWSRAYDADGNYLSNAAGDPVYNPGPSAILQLDPSGDLVPFDGSQLYNYAPVNHFMRPTERFSLGAFADYQINDEHKLYLETSFMRDRTSAQIAESGTFFAQNYALSYDNELLTDTQVAQIQSTLADAIAEFETENPESQPIVAEDSFFMAEIGKRNVEGGQRVDQLEHNAFRIVTGVEGFINDMWSYDLSYQYGSTSSTSSYLNDFYVDRIGPRLGADGIVEYDSEGNPFLSLVGGCSGDCQLYDVFTPNGVTSEQASQMAGSAVMNGNTTQIIYNGFVTGELDFALPGADTPVAAVVGFERREVDYERNADTIYSEGVLAGQGGPIKSITGQIDVNELFAELSLPLLEDAEFADALVLELAGRTSDYTTSGRANTFKVAVDWVITEDWKFRASFNRAIRAPNVTELYRPQGIGLWAGADGCAGAEPDLTEAQCANTGVTAAQYGAIVESPASQYNEFAGGDQDLDPEEADTFTVGIVANPIENLNFTVDYWDIEIENVIDDIGASRILNTCAQTGDAYFCDNIYRSNSGSLWIGETGYIENLPGNIGGRKWRGIDTTANYTFENIAGGMLHLSLNGSYNLEKTYKPLLTDASLDYDCSGEVSVDCFAQPKWRHTVSANYKHDEYSLTARWRYFGEVDYNEGTDTFIGDGLSSYSYLDLSGSYFLNENITLSAGINNLLDKEPPMVGGTLSTNANTVAGFYDTLGRYMFTNVNLRF